MQSAVADLRQQALKSGAVHASHRRHHRQDRTPSRCCRCRWRGTDPTQASKQALTTLRDRLIPATLGTVDNVSVNVSGQTAIDRDQSTMLARNTPLVFGFVLTLAFVLLMVTFRSIVIPIKAIILNLLSVAAAYGVLVAVFQDGHGASLLGFTPTGGVAPWLPLFLFVILFGLSMDYHVFILSRVKELVDGGMSTEDAVSEGIKSTAGTVTSAALVMVGVFSIFMTLSLVDLKEFGVGLAAAVLIDATIIRGVLLPASMKLLGDWNWYLPKPLQLAAAVRGRARSANGGGSLGRLITAHPLARPERPAPRRAARRVRGRAAETRRGPAAGRARSAARGPQGRSRGRRPSARAPARATRGRPSPRDRRAPRRSGRPARRRR